MERKFSILVLFFMVFQIYSQAQIRVGVKAGINISRTRDVISPDFPHYQFSEYQSKVGFLGGVYGSLKLNDNVDLDMEVLYSSKGYQIMQYRVISNFIGSEPYIDYHNFDYITIPVSFVFHVIPSLGITLGGEFGYLISAKEKSDNNPTYDRSSNYNAFDFGLSTGIKYYFLNRFNFDIRYTYGLTNILKDTILRDALGNPYGTAKIYNKAWQFSLSYDLFQWNKIKP